MKNQFSEEHISLIESIRTLELSERAQAIAEMVHVNQKDKAGEPYIGHPRRVASIAVRNMRALKGRFTEQEIELVRQACWLHDVLEDSGENGFPKVLSSDLEAWGMSKDVVELVEVVTKTEPSTNPIYEDKYYIAIKANPLARALKIADITDNHNLDRYEALQELGIASKNSYYMRAIYFLALDSDERMLFDKRINLPKEITDQEWTNGLLEEDLVEPSHYDMSMEDYYYRNLNSGMDENSASRRAAEQVEEDDLFLGLRNAGYSVRRALAKESQIRAEKNKNQEK